MRTRTWLGGAAVVLLVVGVVGTRPETAATDADLAAPEPVTSPRPSPVPEPSHDDVVLLGADGLEGMRLGSAPVDVEGPFTGPGTAPDGPAPADLPGGCEPVWPTWSEETPPEWGQQGWVVEGRVQSVFLSLWDHIDGTVPTLRTWLGPTLGSPMAAAGELPGARTSVERPFGADGPTVTVVRVEADGVEVVFSDAGADTWTETLTDRTSGDGPDREAAEDAVDRVRTLEVRLPRARVCSSERLLEDVPWREAPEVPVEVRISRDGVGAVPLGTPTAQVLALPGAESMGATPEGCEAVHLPSGGDGYLRVVAVDGLVAAVEAGGMFSSDLGVAPGDGMDVVHAAFPRLSEEEQPVQEGHLEVPLDDRVVSIGMWREQRWVPDVEMPVTGGPPVVTTLGVRDAAVPPSRVSC